MSIKTYQILFGLVVTAIMLAACTQEPQTHTQAPGSVPVITGAEPSRAGTVAAIHNSIIEGVVTDSSGQPVAGAFVKLHNADRRLGFMVISQDSGLYTANLLPSGNYTVQGIGGDLQSVMSAPMTVGQDSVITISLTLDQQRAPDLPPAWPRRVPEHMVDINLLPEGPGRDIISKNCSGCHSANQVIASRYEADAWASSVKEMQEMIVGSGLPELSDEDARILVDYLVANLAPLQPPDPNSRLPRQLMQGEARNYRLVEYNLEKTEVETHDVAVDPQGIGWANQRTGGMISRFDPVTYQYSEIGPPLYTRERARPGNLQISSDGIMWLAEPFERRWVSYDIANDKWTDWPFPSDKIRGQVQGNSLVLHHDGTIWMAGPGSARRLNPATGEWSTLDTPTWIETRKNPGGYGITVAGDGRVWMAMNLVDKLARFDGETGEVAEFQLETGAYPRRMDYDNDGNVWVALWGTSKILKVDYKTDELTLIEPPISYNGAYSIDFDKSTNLLWVTLQTVDIIARYNTLTGEWLMLPLAQAEADVRRIEVDQNNPNRIWWVTNAFNARIGYVELLR